ncbi:sensor histidine kinase [Mucilaginibacter sp.]|uniref:sensor histidine kinase n=1 Tax=Mucilaginibacter sp. TaxID=1882438 RepID=UPI0035BC6D11
MFKILICLCFVVTMNFDALCQVANHTVHLNEGSRGNVENQEKSVKEFTICQRKVTIMVLATLVIIAGVSYNSHRNIRKCNFEAQFQKIEIDEQEARLQRLTEERNKILRERNWLLKEVRHRVKNNLQVVTSLLNTQSAYLKDHVAIEAMSDSRNRVHAISLIHQKLYASCASDVDMNTYIKDLVTYLSDSFCTTQKGIHIKQVMDPFVMELEQAIPIGLILNEGITNAIKHAFDNGTGQITIRLILYENNQVLLTLSDNGKGMSPNFSLDQTNTFGMEMMKALCRQLNGSFQIENRNGVTMSVSFRLQKTKLM